MLNTKKIKTAGILTLGCKVNSYESDAMALLLEKEGVNIVSFDEIADVYIINTCSVTAISDKKSRQMIRRAKNKNPESIVVACGCFVEKNADSVKDDCDIVIGNNNKSKIIEKINEYILEKEKISLKTDLFSKDIAYEDMEIDRSAEHTRAFIKIQDGCNAYCTYCVIPFVRGRSRSRSPKEIVKEVRSLSENGYSEIIVSGINLSDYEYEGMKLADIIKAICDVESVKRVRIGSLEPDVFTNDFCNLLKNLEKVCPHFHLSLQSASDNTLKNMGRRYEVKDFKDAVINIRKAFDNPAICADVIAGFTGETIDDFKLSYENIKECNLYELHVFPFSERRGTKAYGMEGKLSKAEKTQRAAELIELSKDSERRFKEAHIGKILSVLFEEKVVINDRDFWLGYSKEYIKCAMETKEDLKGKILDVKALGTDNDGNVLVS